jgi:hypothetical protein
MVELETKHQVTHSHFKEGKFVVRKTNHVFSTIAMDQAHEQINATLKDEGGIIGITENPQSLRRWLLATPEVLHMLEEFQKDTPHDAHDQDTRHHEQVPSTQATFQKHVVALTSTIKDMGDPFLEDSSYLKALDTKNIMNENAVETLYSIQERGKTQYDAYKKEVLQTNHRKISEPIARNKVGLFKDQSTKKRTKKMVQIKTLKNDCNLFSRMYISCQSQDGNIEEFFRHENQAFPPSPSSNGYPKEGTKEAILQCLEPLADSPADNPAVDVKLLDGAVIVMKPASKCSFKDPDQLRTSLLLRMPFCSTQRGQPYRQDMSGPSA